MKLQTKDHEAISESPSHCVGSECNIHSFHVLMWLI